MRLNDLDCHGPLRSAPGHRIPLALAQRARNDTPGRRVLGMNLVACDAPVGVLDEAPHTALRQDTSAEHWDGFWADDDRYYARCTTAAGVAWYRLDDGVEAGPVTSMLSSPLTSNHVPGVGIRRPIVFRVGQGCIVGFRHAVKRPALTLASRARSSDISA